MGLSNKCSCRPKHSPLVVQVTILTRGRAGSSITIGWTLAARFCQRHAGFVHTFQYPEPQGAIAFLPQMILCSHPKGSQLGRRFAAAGGPFGPFEGLTQFVSLGSLKVSHAGNYRLRQGDSLVESD
jgi:hypothetical protein